MSATEPSVVVGKINLFRTIQLALFAIGFFSSVLNSVLAENQGIQWRLVDFSAELATAVFVESSGDLQSIRPGQVFAEGKLKLEGISESGVLIQYLPSIVSGSTPAFLSLNRGEYFPDKPAIRHISPNYHYRINAVVLELSDRSGADRMPTEKR